MVLNGKQFKKVRTVRVSLLDTCNFKVGGSYRYDNKLWMEVLERSESGTTLTVGLFE